MMATIDITKLSKDVLDYPDAEDSLGVPLAMGVPQWLRAPIVMKSLG